ncbi:hypothetical protein BDR26DRAFT_1012214 [Obelidium mucronatum]|nr:hypothetical protein BDR26DRAFT_1012214 [Obelidium mucronatum]
MAQFTFSSLLPHILSPATDPVQLTSLAPNTLLRNVMQCSDAELAAAGDVVEVLLAPAQQAVALVVATARLKTGRAVRAESLRRIAGAPAVAAPSFAPLRAAFAHGVARAAEHARRPLLAVAPLRALLLAGAPNVLTPAHHVFLRHAIAAKAYAAAAAVVARPLDAVDAKAAAAADFLLYAYYAGIVLAALKRFADAVLFFRMALAAPSRGGASAIQVEAWRKGVLCFVLSGQPGGAKAFEKGSVARSTHFSVHKAIDACGKKAYVDFVDACLSGQRPRALLELQANAELFMKSGNLGLAKQCASSNHLIQQQILKLTQTYITLSVSDIAKTVQDSVFQIKGASPQQQQQYLEEIAPLVSPVAIKSHILYLIGSGKVHASINESIREGNGMVSFHDEPESYADLNALMQLDSMLKTAMSVYYRVSEMDKAISLSKEYLTKVGNDEKGVGGGIGRGGSSRMDSFGTIGGGGSGAGVMFDDDGGDDDVMMMDGGGADEEDQY